MISRSKMPKLKSTLISLQTQSNLLVFNVLFKSFKWSYALSSLSPRIIC